MTTVNDGGLSHLIQHWQFNISLLSRPAPTEYGPFHAAYIEKVPDGDLFAMLENDFRTTADLVLGPTGRERGDFRYAPDKWTLKEVVGHMADTERVMTYRALRFSRGDATPLPGFDEATYTPAGHFQRFPLDALIQDLENVRRATISFLGAVPEHAWDRAGEAAGFPVTVRALAYIIVGHELHHQDLIRSRYLAPSE